MGSFGPLLQHARDSRGISLDDVARETRLRKRYLKALEDETLDTLPGGAYNRGYLRTYATHLGLDPGELMRQYVEEEERQAAAGRLLTRPDALETMRQAAERKRGVPGLVARVLESVSGSVGRVVAAVVVVAVMVALVLLGAANFTAVDGQAEASSGSVETSASVRRAAVAVPPVEASMTAAALPSAVPETKTTQHPVAEAPVLDVPMAEEADGEVRSHDQQAASGVVDVAGGPIEARDGPGLSVPQSGVGTGVVDRQLVGRGETFSVGARVVFWTRIVGGRSGDSVRHVWLHNGQTSGVVDLPIEGPTWRTQSRRTMSPESEGTWVVEARDPAGRVLARHEFRCES